MSVSPVQGITELDNFLGATPSQKGVRGQVPTPEIGDETKFLRGDGTWQTVTASGGGSGTVNYVDVAGGNTGLTFAGGPITSSGTITASGVVVTTAGGTGRSSYSVGDLLYSTGSASSLAVRSIGSSGQFLLASGGIPAWVTVTASDIGGVPSTRTIYASGALTGGGDLSADRTISLASIIAAGGPIGTSSQVPVITYDAYGRLTAVTTATITPSAIGAVPTTRVLYASNGLAGGGDLSADRAFSLATLIVAAGPIGSSSVVPVVTYNTYGQLTAVTSATILPTAIGAASATSPFIVTASDPNLSQFRKLQGTANQITASDGGALGNLTIALASIVSGFTVGASTAIPVITFDNYGRITAATSAPPPTSSGGSGSGTTVNTAQATVDFGFASDQEGDIATVTVTATWVLATSYIVVSPYAVATADHDPDDYAAEGITAYAANLASGVGFDIVAAAPNNTWGRYVVNAYGI